MLRKDLIEAAQSAFSSGEISRADLFKIRVASLNPRLLGQIQQAVAEQVAFDSVNSTDKIDWVKIIKELLPIILQLIALFA